MQSFIVQLWYRNFAALKWISVFQLLRCILPSRLIGWTFVDAWVLGNTVCAALAVILSPLPIGHWWSYLFVFWGALRVIEVFVYQMNVLLWDSQRARQEGKEYRLLGYRRSLVLGLQNYAEVVLWFAAIYGFTPQYFKDPSGILAHALGCLYYSVVTITTLGYGDISPTAPIGWLITMVHTLLGVFMALLIISRFLSLLPRPGSIQEADKGE